MLFKGFKFFAVLSVFAVLLGAASSAHGTPAVPFCEKILSSLLLERPPLQKPDEDLILEDAVFVTGTKKSGNVLRLYQSGDAFVNDSETGEIIEKWRIATDPDSFKGLKKKNNLLSGSKVALSNGDEGVAWVITPEGNLLGADEFASIDLKVGPRKTHDLKLNFMKKLTWANSSRPIQIIQDFKVSDDGTTALYRYEDMNFSSESTAFGLAVIDTQDGNALYKMEFQSQHSDGYPPTEAKLSADGRFLLLVREEWQGSSASLRGSLLRISDLKGEELHWPKNIDILTPTIQLSPSAGLLMALTNTKEYIIWEPRYGQIIDKIQLEANETTPHFVGDDFTVISFIKKPGVGGLETSEMIVRNVENDRKFRRRHSFRGNSLELVLHPRRKFFLQGGNTVFELIKN